MGRASDQLVELLRERVGQAEGARAGLIALVDSVVTFFDDNPHVFDLIQRAEGLVNVVAYLDAMRAPA